jgi:predicted short-subunit dehydrogenase-like oxidoreductase (DUF2520 family)
MERYRISFTGAGKVASSLATELKAKGHIIQQIVSPGGEKGSLLANLCGAKWSDIPEFSEDTDIIFVAVQDRFLASVLSGIKCGTGSIVAHTAGSLGMDIFPTSFKKFGVFYPLQTFSEYRKIDFKDIPVFTEASDNETGKVLKNIAESLGSKPVITDIEHRRLLHVAAVFVSNFTNYMLTSGELIATRAGFHSDLLKPLIIETINKAIEKGPVSSQTGPAVRFDYNTIEKHLELLSFSPELQTVYEEISRSIMNFYKHQVKDE